MTGIPWSRLNFEGRSMPCYPKLLGWCDMESSEGSVDADTGYHTINPAEARDLLEALSDPNGFGELADGFKVLSDPTRLRILMLLRRRELCVHDLSALLEKSQSAVSHQLRELRNQGIVRRRKEGRVVYYSLGDDDPLSLIGHMREYLRRGD